MVELRRSSIEDKPSTKHKRKVAPKREPQEAVLAGATPVKNGHTADNDNNITADNDNNISADADIISASVIDADDATVEVGREAWERIKTNGRKLWPDWVLIGEALMVGRQKALDVAHTTKPAGKQYILTFSHWLKKHGFGEDELHETTRRDLFSVLKHLEEIEAWRAELPPHKRLRLNHPTTVWDAWTCPDRGNRGKPKDEEPNKQPISNGESENGSEPTTPHDDDGAEDQREEVVWQRGLLMRANKAIGDAQLHDLWQLDGPPDPFLIEAVRTAADCWKETLTYLEAIANATPQELAEAREGYTHAMGLVRNAKKEKDEKKEAKRQADTAAALAALE